MGNQFCLHIFVAMVWHHLSCKIILCIILASNFLNGKFSKIVFTLEWNFNIKRVQVGKDQEKAPSEKDFHSKNRGGKKPN